MSRPIQRNGQWWMQDDDGTWLLWDAPSQKWLPASTPPPMPAPPPPTLAWQQPTPSYGQPERSGVPGPLAMLIVALSVGAASLGAYWLVNRGDDPAPADVALPDGTAVPGTGSDAGSGEEFSAPYDPAPICAAAMESAEQVYKYGDDVDGITSGVAAIRDLEVKDAIEPKFLSKTALKRRIEREIDKEYSPEEADETERMLVMLGAVPEGFDIARENKKILGEQVLGFYDPATKELVVRTQEGGDLSAFEELTFAHEIEHALADQNFGLGLEDEPSAIESDQALAERAVAEGDATLLMQVYLFEAMSNEERSDLFGDPQILQGQAGFEGTPHYIQRSLIFPYTWGLRFVCDLYADGRWDAVNRGYTDPPRSTAEIMFPERYGRDEVPVRPRIAASLPDGWRKHSTFSVGAADLLFLFEAPGNDTSRGLDDPLGYAGRLDGGSIALWTNGDRSVISMTLVARRGQDLCRPLESWHEAAFREMKASESEGSSRRVFLGSGSASVLQCSGSRVQLARAPTESLAGAAIGD